MTKILIADAIKPSLVMSSEVFKDKIPGSIILIAATGVDALRIVTEQKPDICLIDFDLPDVDGPALIVELRKIFKGPILMTAYPDDNVKKSVLDDLYAFADASAWIRKPVRFEELSLQIDRYLVERRRTGRRFSMELPMELIAKSEGRGKRAPKASGKVLNLSLGGACIKLAEGFSAKKKQELTLALKLLTPKERAKLNKAPTKARAGAKKATISAPETKIKATVAWSSRDGQMGLQFCSLSESQLKDLENFLKSEARVLVETMD